MDFIKYFGAVGFSNFEDSQLKKLSMHMANFKTEKKSFAMDNNVRLYEHFSEFSSSFGVIMRGESETGDISEVFKCFPYALSNSLTEAKHIAVESEGDNCYVMFEDVQSANEIEFQLQNVVDFINSSDKLANISKVNMAALASCATVLLPTQKEHSDERDEFEQEYEQHYRDLLDRARSGDEEANELLDIHEDDTIEAITERLQSEDFYTIVEYYFVPNESKRAAYYILGEIISFDKTTSRITGETVYKINVMAMGTVVDVFVNKKQLRGYPMCGMRLSADIWLQGQIIFD